MLGMRAVEIDGWLLIREFLTCRCFAAGQSSVPAAGRYSAAAPWWGGILSIPQAAGAAGRICTRFGQYGLLPTQTRPENSTTIASNPW